MQKQTWLVAALGLAGAAHAQQVPAPDLNAQAYRPPVDAQDTLWTDDASLGPSGYFQSRIFFNYVNDPLVYQFTDGTEERLLSDLLQADLIGAVSISRLRLGLDVPLMLVTGGSAATGGGLGDLALDLKGVAIEPGDEGPGLAFSGRFTLPTATTDTPVGSPGVGWELAAIGTQQFGSTLLAVNLGTRGQPQTVLENVEWNDQFFWRVGVGQELSTVSGLSADLVGATSYSARLGNPAGSPMEVLFGGWSRVSDDFVFRAGAGTGLTRGIGSPDLRLVAALSFEPPTERDNDLDGIVNKDDACPDQPEDKDGWQDADGCPNPSTRVHITVQDTRGDYVYDVTTVVQTETGSQDGGADFEVDLHPGDYGISAAAERYEELQASISVPLQDSTYAVILTMEPLFGWLKVRVVDPEGRLIPGALVSVDNSQPKSLASGEGELTADPGTQTVVARANGYKAQKVEATILKAKETELEVTLQPAKARITKEKIEILEKVYFNFNKASIKPESFQLLDDVAEILRDNPDIRKIRIEGHTDSRGSDSYNKKLSDRRAKSVRQYLIDAGIDPDRMDAEGYGEERPVDPAQNETAWELNRRVEFVIVDRQLE